MQIAFGLMLSYYAEPEMHGNKKCDIHNWAVYIRYGSTALQRILALLGLDAKGLTSVVSKALSRVLSTDANSLNEGGIFQTSEFSPAELLLANLMISFVVPAFQFVVALAVVDTWIYFTHRIVHANKTLYSKFAPFIHFSNATPWYDKH
jgi:sphinganine C4-monooxygenase